MTTADSFVSYAQNREDVVLWRALREVRNGTYLDVGANDPTNDSVTRAFYDHGWSGIAVEPVASFADRFRRERPRDVVVQAVASDLPGTAVVHLIEDTGLSTTVQAVSERHRLAGFEPVEIEVAARTIDDILDGTELASADLHLLCIDVEGAELGVLRSIDLERHRPWVVVVEATEPLTEIRSHAAWEHILLQGGYEFCFFDGLSHFYLSREHPELRPLLDHPACIFDDYVTIAELEQNAELERVHLAVANEAARADRAQAELAAMRQTLSWRLTQPLRRLRSLPRATRNDDQTAPRSTEARSKLAPGSR